METMVGMGWAGLGYPFCFVLGIILGIWIGYKIWKRKAIEKLKLEAQKLRG